MIFKKVIRRAEMALDVVSQKLIELNARVLVGARFRFTQSVYGPFLCDARGDKTFRLSVHGYGPFVEDAINSVSEPFVFLDIGANAGVFGLLAHNHPLCLQVHAFEPIPATFFRLCLNRTRNRAKRMTVHRAAISGRFSDFGSMHFNPAHSGMAQLCKPGGSNAVVRIVNSTGLDKIVGNPLSAIVVKIDVEGAERDVFRELSNTRFFSNVRRIIVEVSRRNSGEHGTAHLRHMLAMQGFAETARSGPYEHYDALFERDAGSEHIETRAN